MTTKTTNAFSQVSEDMIAAQLRSIEADYQRLFEQKSDALIQLLCAKLHRMLTDEAPPMERYLPGIWRVLFRTEAYNTGVEFNASAVCYDRDDNEVSALDEVLGATDYDEIEDLIGELNTLHSPFDGGESLEARLISRTYILTL